ncbi:hypothetical protein QDR37_01500 [Amnibacterium sp. CER49]|uniref:hypothetical protein n=1 Tax=Amnibacterium sp. CER49 TaxID=3039161 RepID=UPI0024474E20|nr:hypothetical protein [Amnibacterium sp. CER49]MDH2442610.1 hypothetical protein [Amnibacterium sp. CER49]
MSASVGAHPSGASLHDLAAVTGARKPMPPVDGIRERCDALVAAHGEPLPACARRPLPPRP